MPARYIALYRAKPALETDIINDCETSPRNGTLLNTDRSDMRTVGYFTVGGGALRSRPRTQALNR